MSNEGVCRTAPDTPGLLMIGTVNRAGFCGADFTEKKSKIIRKEDTTLKAFTAMINFVYNY